MSKILKDAVKYSCDRISLENVSLENYVTTDNLLQNKQGKVNVESLPPNSVNVTKYNKGDILISNIRPYLKKIWYASHPGGSSADVLTLKVNKNFDSNFIYYTIFQDKFFEHMMNGSKGTKMPRGDKNQILNFPIPNFSISNQKSIAKVLSDLDAKIELNNKINQELEAMAKTLYYYWFVQFDFPFDFAQGKPNEQGKPYKSSGGKMVYNAELKREIPEGWEVKTLGEIATTGSGGTPLSTMKEFYENGIIPWINSGEVNMSFIVSTKNFITQKGLESSSAKMFKRGTILMAMYGATAGKVSLMDIEACTNQAICAINPKEDFYRIYIKLVLEDLYKYLINLSSGSARDNLSQDKIRELKFVIPSKSLILKFDKMVQPSMNKILINLKENQQLSELRDWLLPMLMNGQVTVASTSSATATGSETLTTKRPLPEVSELVEDSRSIAAEPNIEYEKE